jgi:hypothetical protein
MLKKFFILLFSIASGFLFSVSPVFAGNIGKKAYGVFSELFLGVVWDGANDDLVNAATYSISANEPDYSSTESKIDGERYLHMQANANGAWYIFYKDWAGRNMSVYLGGEIEFWVRSSSSNITNPGSLISFGYKDKNPVNNHENERIKTLNELGSIAGTGSFAADGQWHKFVLPLREDIFGNPTDTVTAGLNIVTLPLLIKTSADITFDFDRVVWKKPGLQNVQMEMVVKDRVNVNSEPSKISWSSSAVYGIGWAPSEQYIELSMDYVDYTPLAEWKVLLYTDNKSAGADPAYTGTGAAGGIVCVENPASPVLPLKWRAASTSLNAASLGDGSDWGWLWMQDKSAFYSGGINFGSNYITVMNLTKGTFHYHEGDGDYGSILEAADRKIKLYIAAGFENALPRHTYKTSAIIIGLFNE